MDCPLPKRRKIRKRINLSDSQTENEDSTGISLNDTDNLLTAKRGKGAGTIQRILLKNFLCHENLDFDDFSPKLNFLQGKNGSGKSAIVVALIVGLGGSTRATDRGNSLKGLIQNGKNTATILIYLRNEGYLAYKSEIFGSTIIIERKLALSGANSYKIKSANGLQVSTKKEYLTKILDWFNIQVDNPITILSQERAKTFLSSTDSKDLFNFFMESTFLMQLTEDITSIKMNIAVSNSSVNKKLNSVSGMKKEVQKWKAKHDIVILMRNKYEKINDLMKERSWAEVQEIERELERHEQLLKKSESDKNLCTEQQSLCKNKKQQLESIKSENDEQVAELVNKMKANEAEKENRDADWHKSKTELRFQLGKMKNLQRELTDKQRDIDDLKHRLDKDYDEAKRVWDETNKRLEEEKSQTKEEIQVLKDRVDTKQVELSHLHQTIEKVKEDEKNLMLEKKAIQSRLTDIHRQLNQLQNVNNSLAVFGQHMPRIVEEIEMAKKRGLFTEAPIGPLGRHIKVKDPTWAHIAEQVLSSCITSFLVSNKRDYQEIVKIFNKVIPGRQNKPNVIVCRFRQQLHNYQRFVTGTDEFSSLFDILEIDNFHVANTILDQTSCESTLLIPSCDDAIHLLSERSRVPANCKVARTLNGDTIYPDPNYKIFSGNRDKRVVYLQVSVQDKIEDLKKNAILTDDELKNFVHTLRESTRENNQLMKQVADVSKHRSQYENQLKRKHHHLQELINQELPPPSDVYQLQQDLKEHEERKDELQENMTSLHVRLKIVQTDKEQKEEVVNAANVESKVLQDEIRTIKNAVVETLQSLTMIKKKELFLSSKFTEFVNMSRKNGEVVSKMRANLDVKRARVSAKFPDRVETRRSVEDIVRNLSIITTALRRVEEEHGDTVNVHTVYKEKTMKLASVENEIDSHKAFIKSLQGSLECRMSLFGMSKRLLRAAITSEFAAKISYRGFKGLIDVDYNNKTLRIMVKKATLTDSDPYQSIKMMSGGERSFATVSFLIALWHLTGSPLTVMDEFDIFMDFVSKNQCIDIIMNSLRNSQYILISPQEYRLDKSIHTFRMPDPERGLSQVLPIEDIDEDE